MASHSVTLQWAAVVATPAVMLFPCAYLVWMERHNRFMCMHAVATTFWLAGNWWWMIGENWDDNYHTDNGPVYESHTRGAEVRVIARFVWYNRAVGARART